MCTVHHALGDRPLDTRGKFACRHAAQHRGPIDPAMPAPVPPSARWGACAQRRFAAHVWLLDTNRRDAHCGLARAVGGADAGHDESNHGTREAEKRRVCRA
eukprot:scaffold86545_cov39-Tisochrysis_lutea.AAC.1